MKPEARKLAAIMFTDMVGFSRLMHADEQKCLAMLDTCNEVISLATTSHGGDILKKMGDAVLAEFSSATAAVACAIDIQTRLRDYNGQRPANDWIILRIGIHLGDVVVRDRDLLGDGINVAARLEPLSDPGGVCISEAVYQAVASSSPVKPVRIGEVELKNIFQKHVIYKIPALYEIERREEPHFAKQHSTSYLNSMDQVAMVEPPSRSLRALLLPVAFLIALSIGAGMMVGASSDNPNRILTHELVDPGQIVSTLLKRPSKEHEAIWASLDSKTRALLEKVDPALGVDGEVLAALSRSLSQWVISERPIDGSPTEGLRERGDGEVAFQNRRRLEELFPNGIQRLVVGHRPVALLQDHLRRAWISRDWGIFVLVVVTWVLLFAGGSYLSALSTLQIRFTDIRGADQLLDFYVRDLGFKAPERQGEDLVFRATWWTTLKWSVLAARARVNGNTVFLTCPAPLARSIRRRMLRMSAGGGTSATGNAA